MYLAVLTDLFVKTGDGCNVGSPRFESLHQQVRAGKSRLFVLNPTVNPLTFLLIEVTAAM
jgi:hypothetical protein